MKKPRAGIARALEATKPEYLNRFDRKFTLQLRREYRRGKHNDIGNPRILKVWGRKLRPLYP